MTILSFPNTRRDVQDRGTPIPPHADLQELGAAIHEMCLRSGEWRDEVHTLRDKGLYLGVMTLSINQALAMIPSEDSKENLDRTIPLAISALLDIAFEQGIDVEYALRMMLVRRLQGEHIESKSQFVSPAP